MRETEWSDGKVPPAALRRPLPATATSKPPTKTNAKIATIRYPMPKHSRLHCRQTIGIVPTLRHRDAPDGPAQCILAFCGMSFDNDPESPDRMIQPEKPTTKVNFAVVAGVLLFFIIGIVVILTIARR